MLQTIDTVLQTIGIHFLDRERVREKEWGIEKREREKEWEIEKGEREIEWER